jgi:hypothetical protein
MKLISLKEIGTNHEETKRAKGGLEPISSSFLRVLRFFVVCTTVPNSNLQYARLKQFR